MRSKQMFERGGVLIMVAALMIPLLIAMTLAIDLNAGRAARSQAEKEVQFALLAALEAYVGAGDDCTSGDGHACRMAAATTRFNTAIATTGVITRPGAQPIQLNTSSYSSEHGRLIAGKWELDNDSLNLHNCQSAGKTSPCFLPLTSSETAASALRFEGRILDSLGSLGFSRKLLNFGGFRSDVSATVAASPRTICLLVDLSPSIAAENFTSATRRYTYGLSTDNGSAATSDDAAWAALAPADQAKYRRRFVYGDSDWALMPDTIRKLHPDPSQYDGFFRQAIYRGTALGHRIRVDLSPSASGYRGPEPMASILSAAKAMVLKFKARRVRGDRICAILYDDSTLWSRTLLPTADFDAVANRLDFTNNYTSGSFGTVADDDAAVAPTPLYNSALFASNPREWAARAGYLPDYNFATNTPAFSDPVLAYKAALVLFRKDFETTKVRTKNEIILVHDNLSNCNRIMHGLNLNGQFHPNSNVRRECANQFGSWYYSSANGNMWPQTYNNSNGVYRESIVEPINNQNPSWANWHWWSVPYDEYGALPLAIKEARDKDLVTTHVVLHSKLVGPHDKDYAKPGSNPPECMDDKEFRASVIPFHPEYWVTDRDTGNTTGLGNTTYMFNWFTNASAANPFHLANYYAYQHSMIGRGRFVPVRDPDTGCSSGARLTCSTGTVRWKDPYCRSQENQILEGLKTILKDNPFFIAQIS